MESAERPAGISSDNQLFYEAFRASPIGIALEDLEGRPLFVNPALCSMLGFSEKELCNKHCVDFSPAEDAEKDWVFFEQLRAGLIDHYSVEKRYFRRDGSLMWGRLSISLLNKRMPPLVMAMVEDITEKRTAQEELLRSEADLQKLATDLIEAREIERQRFGREHRLLETLELVTKQMAGAVTHCGRDLRYLWANQGYANWLGRPLHQIVGQPISEVVGRGAFESLQPYFERVLAGQKVAYEGEINYQGIGRRWISAVLTPTFDEVDVTGWVAVVLDLTERKRIEEALKKSEEKFSRIFRESPLAVTLTSARDHRFIDVNQAFERITGWSREEIVGRTPFELGNWVDPGKRVGFMSQLLAGGCVRNAENQFRMRNGEVRTGFLSMELIEINGETCALSVVADVTDLRRSEEARRVAERRFSQFFTAVPEYCYMISPEGHILDANPATCEALGYTREELVGKLVSIIYAPESPLTMDDLLEKWKKTGRLCNEEIVILTKRGEKRVVLVNAGSVADADGNLLHSTSVHVDITDRKLAEEALSKVSQRLIEAHEEERRWIGCELHDDINQRLALLAVNLDRLEQNIPVPAVDARQEAIEARKQVEGLVSDVQALSHRLHSSKLETLGLIAASASFCREIANRQKLQIDFQPQDIPKDLPKEVSLCLFRVLQEALQNAAKHSGSQRFQVTLKGGTESIELTVQDSGAGFDPEEVVNGHGIGLISMKERLKLVNGTLSIDSQRYRGTRILACVPLPPRTRVAEAAG